MEFSVVNKSDAVDEKGQQKTSIQFLSRIFSTHESRDWPRAFAAMLMPNGRPVSKMA